MLIVIVTIMAKSVFFAIILYSLVLITRKYNEQEISEVNPIEGISRKKYKNSKTGSRNSIP